jgi:hypothetical protein
LELDGGVLGASAGIWSPSEQVAPRLKCGNCHWNAVRLIASDPQISQALLREREPFGMSALELIGIGRDCA